MKKIIVVSALFFMCLSGSAFAADLDGLASGLVTLSKGVTGTYFPNANPATDFAASTGHAQGNQVYASGSFTAAIWKKDIAGTSFASSDLLSALSGSVDEATVFSGYTEI